MEKGGTTVTRNNSGWTLLDYACADGQLEVVKYLIEKGGVPADSVQKSGCTPRGYASFWGNVEGTEYLMEKAAWQTP